MNSNDSTEYQLTRAEVDFYIENGYLGPYAAMSPAEMMPIRQDIERHVLNSAGPNPRRPMQSRHMDNAAVYDLAAHPAIIGRIAGVRGRTWSSGPPSSAERSRQRRNPLAPGHQLLAH